MVISDWIFLQNTGVVSAILFAILVGGAVGLPFPEDLPLIVAGVVIHRGHVNKLILFLCCYVGIILGDMIIYFIGRKIGGKVSKRNFFTSRITPQMIERTKSAIEKRSILTIFIARHLFYLRTVTFLTCGAVKMEFKRFLIADCIAALVSASLMMSIGYFFSDNYEAAIAFFQKTKYGMIGLGVFAVVVILLWFRFRAKSTENSSTSVIE